MGQASADGMALFDELGKPSQAVGPVCAEADTKGWKDAVFSKSFV